jgi:hypothetical protein
MNKLPSTKVITSLSISSALCTFEEAIKNAQIIGSFSNFMYSEKNGRQIILDHGYGDKLEAGTVTSYNHSIFITRQDGRYKKHVTTWEELRQHLSEGWVLGTARRQGIKVNLPDSGRNNRLQPEKIYVFQK